MYIAYEDIVERIDAAPLWWLYGVPRYDPFDQTSVDVYAREVALVRTECQTCEQPFDVAVHYPSARYRHPLRYKLAFQSRLDIGDPPQACRNSACRGSMTSVEVEVLQFWRLEYEGAFSHWLRDTNFERVLDRSAWHGSAVDPVTLSVETRLRASPQWDDWHRAYVAGDFDSLVGILTAFGCEHTVEVANMLDIERRFEKFGREMGKLWEARLQEAPNPFGTH
jgi:hypothetical protein